MSSLDSSPRFPSEFVSPKEKEDAKYGAEYAEAMYNSSSRHGARLLHQDSEYDALTELAQGRQSVDGVKKLFGYYDSSLSMDDGAEDLSYIDIQVLNLAPKYINRAVGRLQSIKYDISASILDAKSIDEEKQFQTQLRAYYELRGYMKKIGVNAQELFKDLDVSSLPDQPDELMYEMTTNPKVKKVIRAEKLMKLLHYSNNWDQTWREIDWDFVVYGKGFTHCFLDENGSPREERINGKWAVYPYSESENWDNTEYFGFIDFVPVNRFIRESAKDFTVEQQQEIISEYARDNQYYNASQTLSHEDRFDGMAYLPILKYYFLSEDRRVYDSKKSKKTGNKILVERAYDYTPPEDIEKMYHPKGPNKIIENTYTSLYGGSWIIDSKVAYNHRRIDYPRTSLVDMKVPIKAYAPNYKEGRVVSLAAQMIEPLFMINVAWNKMKDILAKGWMGVREIDFNELEKVAMGKGGKSWDARQVYEHLLKTNTLIKRGKTNKYDQSTGKSIVDNPAGLAMADYMNTITLGLRMLDELTGTSSFEGSAPPERLAVGVANANLQATHETMEYLYTAHHRIYLETSKTMLGLAQMSHKNGNKVAGNAFGEYFEMDDALSLADIGLMLERQPTEQEWANFYVDLREQAKVGAIRSADLAFIREVSNLKEARRILAIREEKYAAQKRQEVQGLHENQMELTEKAATSKLQAELAKIKEKGAIDRELALLQGQIDEMLGEQAAGYKSSDVNAKSVSDLAVKTQEGKDRILTQGMKNIVEKEKVDKRQDRSPED